MSRAPTLSSFFPPPLEGGAGGGLDRKNPLLSDPVRVVTPPPTPPSRGGEKDAGVSNPIVLAAGGTGGHFFPAEALAGVLLERGRAVVLLTDARSGGGGSPVFSEHPVHVLRGAGIAGRGAGRAAAGAVALAAGTVQARKLLATLRPGAVVAFGGYPSVAPVVAARLSRHRPKVILHEQNAVLGRANRFLARAADVLALSFAATARVPAGTKTVLTGNPVRPAIAALSGNRYAAPVDDDPLRLLVLGGSLGATVLSDVVPAALCALPEGLRRRLRVVQQCRAQDLSAVRAAYAQAGIEALLATFFTDVAGLLDEAHLVVARAGASTVAELAVVGRPAVLVPLPGAIDDHQSANAAALGDGAWQMPQPEFTPDRLGTLIERLASEPALLEAAAERVAAHGRARAAEALADLVERTIGTGS